MLDKDAKFQTTPPGIESKGSFALGRLRHALVTCELLPGSFVTEAALDERFLLGRASVRAALARLEVESFVRPAPRAGWQVAPITGASIGDVLSAQRMFACSLAGLSLPEETARALARTATQADALLGRGEAEVVSAARTLRRGFLAVLAGAQGELVAAWMAHCLDLEQRMIIWFERTGPRWSPLPLSPVAEALLAGNGAVAAAALEDNVRQFRGWLAECLMRSKDMILAPQHAEAPRPLPAIAEARPLVRGARKAEEQSSAHERKPGGGNRDHN